MEPGPRRFRRLVHVEVAGVRVPVAGTSTSRLLGLALLPRRRAGNGLLIRRCRSVHTIGMRFSIDVVFLDGAGREIRRAVALPPWRAVRERRASAVLELPAERPEIRSPGTGSGARPSSARSRPA